MKISTTENKLRAASILLILDKMNHITGIPDHLNRVKIAEAIASKGYKIRDSEILKNKSNQFDIIKLRYSNSKTISKKPINIILNWEDLITSLPEISLTIIGAVTDPYVFVLSALSLGIKVNDMTKLELNKTDAEICIQIFENPNITVPQLIMNIKSKILNINKAEIMTSIDKLIKIKAIKVHEDKLILLEEVVIS